MLKDLQSSLYVSMKENKEQSRRSGGRRGEEVGEDKRHTRKQVLYLS
jgi:hypothetical protein